MYCSRCEFSEYLLVIDPEFIIPKGHHEPSRYIIVGVKPLVVDISKRLEEEVRCFGGNVLSIEADTACNRGIPLQKNKSTHKDQIFFYFIIIFWFTFSFFHMLLFSCYIRLTNKWRISQ